MSDRSPFGTRLSRLLAHRLSAAPTKADEVVTAFARDSGLPESELAGLLAGAQPSSEILRTLGSALGIPAADMFVIASLPVPDDLASAWKTTPWHVGTIVETAAGMPPAQIARLDELVRSLPLQARTTPPPPDTYPDGPGAVVSRLMMNRNIAPYAAKALYFVGGGPLVSYSTVGQLGTGKVTLTPRYVTAFAHVLGYAPGDLVAITGVGPVPQGQPRHRSAAQIAALAWNARHLTSDQIRHVLDSTRRIS
ncbi:MAG: hypothetical protein HOV78_13285 [Hamadaea sp.]|nr:hypothetical protein [Hamadaea sp.]